MVARLGKMLYWAATFVVILIIGGIAFTIFFGNGRVEPFARVSIVIWLIGLACRLVLAGSKHT